MTDEPGPLIGRGRAADVYDIGGGRVLRRFRTAPATGGMQREAAVMRHLAGRGFAAPAVYDVTDTDLVMDRLDGHTMLTDLQRRPWRVDRHADLWADLHRRLAEVPVGGLVDAGLPVRFGDPTSVLHLDFHPDNIMLTSSGPVVIDWTNAALGPAPADVALAWITSATSTVDGSAVMRALIGLMRNRLIGRFVDRCGRADAIAILPVVAEHRRQDRNVRPEEAARIDELVASLT